jgi:hypothetical protein
VQNDAPLSTPSLLFRYSLSPCLSTKQPIFFISIATKDQLAFPLQSEIKLLFVEEFPVRRRTEAVAAGQKVYRFAKSPNWFDRLAGERKAAAAAFLRQILRDLRSRVWK